MMATKFVTTRHPARTLDDVRGPNTQTCCPPRLQQVVGRTRT